LFAGERGWQVSIEIWRDACSIVLVLFLTLTLVETKEGYETKHWTGTWEHGLRCHDVSQPLHIGFISYILWCECKYTNKVSMVNYQRISVLYIIGTPPNRVKRKKKFLWYYYTLFQTEHSFPKDKICTNEQDRICYKDKISYHIDSINTELV
jgi:hypothetical protein